jgi:hypothetical protein
MRRLLEDAAARRGFAEPIDPGGLGGSRWPGIGPGDFLVAQSRASLVGMMGLWDQRGFQRIRIKGYGAPVCWLRPAINRFLPVPLPAAGACLPLIKATAVACRDDDPRTLRAMLASALGEMGGNLLLLGMSSADPLAAALDGIRARRDHGRHFLVGWEGTPPKLREPFAFDVARI